MLTSREQIELFHLMFLRQFNAQIDSNFYSVKGGCNLRFFFNSVRYSEDLDLDIRVIQKQTLENKVSKILSSQPLLKSLQGYGITQIKVTSPKQSNTTQRWKIQLYAEQVEMPYHTKIEFSRRSEVFQPELENISMKICQTYHLSPLRLPHYGLPDAVTQKIFALSNRLLTQARDIFDLYHLLHFSRPPQFSFKKTLVEKAQEALLSISFDDYKSQVVNFLEPAEQSIFDSKDYWKTISNEVYHYLSGLEQ